MLLKTVSKLTTLLAISLFSFQANAGLVLEEYASGAPTPDNIGGYAMTDFAVTNFGNEGTQTSSTASPISGSVLFRDYHENALNMTREISYADDTDPDNIEWWKNGEGADYDIFTTGTNWVELILPENTRAFSFNVGADLTPRYRDGEYRNNAWLSASGTFGGTVEQTRFAVNYENTPGFGIYAEPSANGECGAITSVIIDPEYWGLGNFSINQGACAVPEPSSVALLGLGLIGLVSLRMRAAK